MQLYDKFTSVSLSGNKITGTLLDSYQPPSYAIDMSVNRLSGPLPPSLRDTNSSVSVVSGNLFGCPILSNDLANQGVSDVSCGSQSLDFSVYTWLVSTVTAIALTLCLLVYNSSTIVLLKSRVLVWMKASYHHIPSIANSTRAQSSNSLLHTVRAVKVLESVSSMSIVVLVMFVLVVMMAYTGMKTHRVNSVYQVQYLYTVTAAFFVGVSPAVVVWIFVVISGAIVGILCVRSRPLVVSSVVESSSVHRVDHDDSKVSYYQEYRDSLQKLALQSSVVITIIAIALAINYGFVETIYFGQLSNLAATQFVFTVIKIIFNSIVVPLSSKLIRREYRSVYSMTMKILVTTAIPALAVLIGSPLCLYNELFPAAITDTYIHIDTYFCYGSYCKLATEPVTTSFIPPWNYSYQCSSSFLVSYLSNFVYLYTISGIVMPLIHFIMMSMNSSQFTSSLLLGHSVFAVPDINDSSMSTKPQVEMSVMSSPVHSGSGDTSKSDSDTTVDSNRASLSKSSDFTIDMSDIIPSICVDITLLLTFGLASPLLAIPISFSIIINTLLLRLALGRYIVVVSSATGQAACYQKLESAFQDAWKGLSGTTVIITITIITIITIITVTIRFMGNHECIRWSVLVIVCI